LLLSIPPTWCSSTCWFATWRLKTSQKKENFKPLSSPVSTWATGNHLLLKFIVLSRSLCFWKIIFGAAFKISLSYFQTQTNYFFRAKPKIVCKNVFVDYSLYKHRSFESHLVEILILIIKVRFGVHMAGSLTKCRSPWSQIFF
jgi:hypothetical protein